jgi:transaldolase
MGRLRELHDAGVSIWLDTLSRGLLTSGEFQTLVDELSVTGATSNPTIFATAIRGADTYDAQVRSSLAAGETDPQALFFDLALDDVASAADVLRPAYDAAGGRDGFVSFECAPDLADDTQATIEQALMLWGRLDRPNVMIKVPATAAGVGAIEELTARGVNVNVTLLFARSRYDQVIDAYLTGLERRVAAGEPVDTIASVASFFVSRVDAKADKELPEGSPLRGGSPSPMPSSPTSSTGTASRTCAGSVSQPRALDPNSPCGPAPAPRIPATPTSSTSRS